MVKPSTIRIVLSISFSESWSIHQLDIKNAFLHGHLTETVYMHQPLGLRDPTHPDYVCRLRKSLYGLKQAPRAWYQRFANFVATIGFLDSISDSSVFIYRHGFDIAYLLLYVDDIILTTSFDDLRQSIMSKWSSEFPMKDLGPLSYFLGIAVSQNSAGLFHSQHKYVSEILDRAGMSQCKPALTLVNNSRKLCIDAGSPYYDPTLYRNLVGALQYITLTRLYISYAVQQVCLFMHDPRVEHMAALYRILRYVKELLITVFHCISPLSPLFYHTLMLIGVVVLTTHSF